MTYRLRRVPFAPERVKAALNRRPDNAKAALQAGN
jgi:hypothetical protein